MGGLTAADYRAFAMRIAQRDAPRTLTSIGLVVVGFALLNMALPPPTAPGEFVGIVGSGAFMVGLGRVLGRRTVRSELVPWAFCGAITLVMACLLQVYFVEADATDLTYVLVGVTAYAPLSHAWRPYLVSGTVILVLTHVTMARVDQPDREDWFVGFLAAFVVGGVLLHLRLRLLHELADAESEIARRATTDPLTGLLTRQGLSLRVADVWGRGRRSGEPVCVWFCDVRGLKRANDEHGHEFGDAVLVDAARALRAAVRAEDLVARWGGDEFVVLGVGTDGSAEALHQRVVAQIAADGVARRDWWGGDVTVGLATAPAVAATFAELLERADRDMYDRRRSTGAPEPRPTHPRAA